MKNKYLVKKNVGEIFKVNMFGEQVHFLNDIEFITEKPLEEIVSKDDLRTEYIWKVKDDGGLTQIKELIKTQKEETVNGSN